jgi:hypothetical protein
MAWTLRAAIDSALLFVIARRLLSMGTRSFFKVSSVGVAGAMALASAVVPLTLAARVGVVVAFLALFGMFVWRRLLTMRERGLCRQALRLA